MARLVIVVLATVLFTVAGLAFADTTVPQDTATEAAAAAVPAFGPTASDDQIGTSEDDGSYVVDDGTSVVSEAPIGGPDSIGTFSATPAESPASRASTVELSALVGAVACVASYFI